jgi:hypothetical protein
MPALHFSLYKADFNDTAASIGATHRNAAKPFDSTLVAKADASDAILINDSPDVTVQGSMASITSVIGCASNGTRIVAVGAGGVLNAYTDNSGGTWSAGGSGLSGTIDQVLYDPTADQFVAPSRSDNDVYFSPDGSTAWTSGSSLSVTTFPEFGILASGRYVGAEAGVFVASVNSGVSYSLLTDDLPAAGSADLFSLAGCPEVADMGDYVYAIVGDGTSEAQCWQSPDGVAWSPGGYLAMPAGEAYTAHRLMICQTTGLMVVASDLSGGGRMHLHASMTKGATWVGPVAIRDVSSLDAFAVASGRVIYTRSANLFVSDPVRV